MARTQLRGGDQILNYTVVREDLTLDFLGGTNWDITNGALDATITGLAAGTNASDAVNKGQLDAAISGLGSPFNIKGDFDASLPSPDFDAMDNSVGDFYTVSAAGTYLGIDFQVGDALYFKNEVLTPATPVAADIVKIDNTEATDILRTGDVVDNLTTQDGALPLSANQGYVLNGLISALDAQVHSFKIGEALTVTHNSPNLPALANTPVAGTVALYLNGLRLKIGSGNDYTIIGDTITMEYNLKTNDQVECDYQY